MSTKEGNQNSNNNNAQAQEGQTQPKEAPKTESKAPAQAQQSKPNLQVQSVRSIATLGTMSEQHSKKKKRWYDKVFWQMTFAEWFIVLAAIISTWIVIAFFFWAQLEISEVIRATDYLVIPDVWYLNTRYNYEYTFTYIPGQPSYNLGQRNLIYNRPECENEVGNPAAGVPMGKEDFMCTQYPQYPWQRRYFAQPGSKTRTGNQQGACSTTQYITGYTPYNYQVAALNGDGTALNNTCLFGLYTPLFQDVGAAPA